MPAVALAGNVLVALTWDFRATPRWPREWTVSVRRPSPYRGPTFGLFDPTLDLRHEALTVLAVGSYLGLTERTPPSSHARSRTSGTWRLCCGSSVTSHERGPIVIGDVNADG